MLVKKAHALDSSFTHIHTIASVITKQNDKYELLNRDKALDHMKSFQRPQ